MSAVPDAGMFFLIAALVVAVVAVVLLRGQTPAGIGLIVFTLIAAGLAGLALVGVLGPLVGLGRQGGPTIGGRARVALERDKALTLRAIKELEFDRAMDKVSEADFIEMRDRLRQRALRLMRQLEGGDIYRQMIERDVQAAIEKTGVGSPAPDAPRHEIAGACAACGTVNDADARFCKHCGARQEPGAGGQGA
jgi:hypothetical protein